MAQQRPLRDAIAGLERVQTDIIATATRQDERWKRDLVELRRQLQLQMTEVRSTAGRCAALNSNTALAGQLRERFAQMRSTIALHQANWPVVTIDREDPAYRESLTKVRAASQGFIAFVHGILPEIEP